MEARKYPEPQKVEMICNHDKHPYFKMGVKYFISVWQNQHTGTILVHHAETSIKAQNRSLTVYDEESFEHDWRQFKIEWDRKELIDNHGSGCSYWMMEGEGNDGKKYTGYGNYQGDELIDVYEIEEDGQV